MKAENHAFWRKKHFAPKNMKCNYANLSAVCKGETVEMIYEGSKTARLQRDNYVLDSRTELKDIRLSGYEFLWYGN